MHVSTGDEVPVLAANKDLVTMECLTHHLTFAAPECYERLGTFAQMNPPVRDARHREALWQAVRDGVVDCIGSDHAPHTKEEKAKPYPQSPSGMPGVQTLLPIMLDHMNAGRLTLQRVVDLTSAGPARIYNIAAKGRIALGYDADLAIVDLKEKREITNDWIRTKCGWDALCRHDRHRLAQGDGDPRQHRDARGRAAGKADWPAGTFYGNDRAGALMPSRGPQNR